MLVILALVAGIAGVILYADVVWRVWDDWDGISTEGEDAHRYLNLIGDGAYCAV